MTFKKFSLQEKLDLGYMLFVIVVAGLTLLCLSGCATVRPRDNGDDHDIQWMREHGQLKAIPEGATASEHIYVSVPEDK